MIMTAFYSHQNKWVSARNLLPVIRRFDPPQDSPPDMKLTFVNEIAKQLQSESNKSIEIQTGVHRLFVECKRLRDHLPRAEWTQCIQRMRESELLGLVHQDPFTKRAFSKPRGYAGDAVMMDFIYGQEEDWKPPATSSLGLSVFQYTTSAAASSGVRARRENIAEQLDDVARNHSAPDVLAVACGHLREASMSSAVRRRKFGKFIALDADQESLKVVDENFGKFGIQCEQSDIRKMLTGRLNYGTFDLIYSTGLFDYLNRKTAQRLTYHLFSMLNPGGKLVLANFLPSIYDIGYMEAFMDWFLVYRDRLQMVGLTELIHQEYIWDLRIRVEENQNIIFLEVTRN